MGFREDITAISKCLAPQPERQTFLFSATVSREIQQIAQQVLSRNHTYINCVSEEDSPVHALSAMHNHVNTTESYHGKLDPGSASKYNGTYAKQC